MILPSFVLPDFKNQSWKESGIDSLDRCFNQKHFLNFPWPVEYCYNSRGYRDNEWPEDVNELSDATWCIGDSFTVGIGSPLSHTWPRVFANQTQHRIINVSLDGASNNWIARKISELVTEIVPKTIVIHWSYLHRRENNWDQINQQWNHFYRQIRNIDWPDCNEICDFFNLPEDLQHVIVNNVQWTPKSIKEFITPPKGQLRYMFDAERRMHTEKESRLNDVDNTLGCIESVESIAQSHNINVIHSFIPDFAARADSDKVCAYLKEHNVDFVTPFKRLDHARDLHHYDIKTSEFFVEQICKRLSCSDYSRG